MSQPLAIIAKVEIGETAYKKYLRSDAVKNLVKSMYYCIKYETKDFYIFQYNKKVNTLNILIYYNYGNAEILKGSDFESIKAIETLVNYTDKGYLLATTDSANWSKEDFSYIYVLDNGKWTEQEKIDESLYKDAITYVDKQYKKLDGAFADKALTSRVVDDLIIKKIVAIKEKDRQENLVNRLPEAAPYQPLYMFGDYYYNGVCVYTRSTPLFEINPRKFVQTPYGGADDAHVVVANRVIKTNPTKFKKLQKGETEYYISEDTVYDWLFEPIKDADPTTFKLKSQDLAEDSLHIYFAGTQISKSSLGQFRIERVGDYFYQILLIGEGVVYNGTHKLEIDAPTFKLNKIQEAVHSIYFWFTGQDKDGDFLYTNINNECSVLRNIDIDKTIEDYKEQYKYVRDERTNEQKLVDTIENPNFKECFDEKYTSYLVDVNNYFYYRHQNWLKTNNKDELDKILEIYSIVADKAWYNPYLFHHTACTYAALGDIPKAVEEVKKACVFGYEKANLIWEDVDLKSLHSSTVYQQLFQHYQETIKHFPNKPPLNIDVLEKTSLLSDSEVSQVFYTISKRFIIPDKQNIETMRKAKQGDKNYWDRYETLLTRLFNLTFTAKRFDSSDYKNYKDYELMPIWGHFGQLQYQFTHAHIAGPTFEDCRQTVEKIKIQLTQLKNKHDIINTMNKANVVRILGVKFE